MHKKNAKWGFLLSAKVIFPKTFTNRRIFTKNGANLRFNRKFTLYLHGNKNVLAHDNKGVGKTIG